MKGRTENGQNGAKIEERTQKREKSVDQLNVCAVAEITVIPMRAEAADYHTKTRNSLTAQSSL